MNYQDNITSYNKRKYENNLKKMREKFDTIESLPPNESVLELEHKYKNLKKIQDIQIYHIIMDIG